jgi:mono/diheme cytochrome c family protein
MNRAVTSLFLAAALLAPGCKKDEKKKADAPKPDKPAAAADAGAGAAGEKPAADAALLERGRYVADVAGCMHCHTAIGPNGPVLDEAWAGGLEVTEKFGTWRSPNITPDNDTGIGSWTDQQIIDAIREGKRPTGDTLLPIMPYPFYNQMSNDDARALVAFMRTVPAVSKRVERATGLKLPPVPVPAATGEAPNKADPVAYGGYLASVMHCAMCHTPLGKDGLDMSKAFAGGFPFELPPQIGTGVIYSPNITPDEKTGIGAYTEEDVIRSVKEMKKKDGSPIMPPMALYQTGWYRLEDADGKALAAFLKSLKPVANKVPKSTFKMAAPPPGGAPPPGTPGQPVPEGQAPDKAPPADKPVTP